MKCEVCKRKINWDNSVGYEEFIVCNRCVNEMVKNPKDLKWIMKTIFRMAIVRREYGATTKKGEN